MENEERNPKPKATNSNTPSIVLGILFAIVVFLLYVGWNLMSDDASNITDMKAVEITAKTEDKDQDLIDETAPKPVEEPDEIIIPEPTPVVVEEKKEEPKKEEPKKEVAKSNYDGKTAIHTVKEGETFFGIANKFNTSQETLKALNPDVNPNGIKIGITKLNVPVQAVHTVGPGDILRVVAEKYGITVESLMAANGKKRNFSERGEKLLIPHKSKK